jgi:hypothetical protein
MSQKTMFFKFFKFFHKTKSKLTTKKSLYVRKSLARGQKSILTLLNQKQNPRLIAA